MLRCCKQRPIAHDRRFLAVACQNADRRKAADARANKKKNVAVAKSLVLLEHLPKARAAEFAVKREREAIDGGERDDYRIRKADATPRNALRLAQNTAAVCKLQRHIADCEPKRKRPNFTRERRQRRRQREAHEKNVAVAELGDLHGEKVERRTREVCEREPREQSAILAQILRGGRKCKCENCDIEDEGDE